MIQYTSYTVQAGRVQLVRPIPIEIIRPKIVIHSPDTSVFEIITSAPRQLTLGDAISLRYEYGDSHYDELAMLTSVESFYGRYVLITVTLYDRILTRQGVRSLWIDGQFFNIPPTLYGLYDAAFLDNIDYTMDAI